MVNKAVLVVAAVATLSACGGGSSSSAPSNPPAATITITTSGVSPKSVTVARGSQVQFVNSDTASHEMASNPHPEHTDCQEINSVGFLSPNQSRMTGNLNIARACAFHDHSRPENTALQGTITIQ
jgi:plastocyanin